MLFLHHGLAVIPFRQGDAGANRGIVLGRRGQVEVEFDARLGGLPIAGQRQLVEILCRILGIRILVVIVGPVDPHVLGPGWQTFGAEHVEHRILVFRRFNLLGLVRFLGCFRGAAALRRQLLVGIGYSACGSRFGSDQPEQDRLRRPGFPGGEWRQAAQAAGVAQSLV